MTEQEVLERCDILINSYSINNGIYDAFKDNEKGYPTFNKMREFAEMCKEAVEKQIAKNVLVWGDNTEHCPCCDKDLTALGYLKHCNDCGQRLNWSEV